MGLDVAAGLKWGKNGVVNMLRVIGVQVARQTRGTVRFVRR